MESKSLTILIWTVLATGAVLVKAETPLEPCIFDTCQCYQHTENVLQLFIECENQRKTQVTPGYFPKMMENATKYSVSSMLVRNYAFEQIPAKAFDGLVLSELILVNNELERLTETAFDGVKGLMYLSVKDDSSFKAIEPGVFDSLKNLSSLELENIGMDENKYASFLPGISKLNRLARLSLNKNQLTKFDSNSFKGLLGLLELFVDENQLVEIAPDTFAQNGRLEVFHAEGNKFENLEQIFKALKQVSDQTESTIRAYLDKNNFMNLSTSTVVPRLAGLSVTGNPIQVFDDESLVGTNEITALDLSNNKIDRFDDSRLQAMTSLSDLRLSHNFISKVPSIANQRTIVSLDISSQNGKLSRIHNYAFEREKLPFDLLEINLSGNDIRTFGTKAFCSRNYNQSYISAIKFSFENMKTIPKCLLTQLSDKQDSRVVQIDIAEPNESTTDYSEVCNCDLLLFSQFNGFSITGVCETVFQTLQCNSATYLDLCIGQTQYDCKEPATVPTTTVIPNTQTTKRTTTTKNSIRKSLNSSSHASLLLILCFLQAVVVKAF